MHILPQAENPANILKSKQMNILISKAQKNCPLWPGSHSEHVEGNRYHSQGGLSECDLEMET